MLVLINCTTQGCTIGTPIGEYYELRLHLFGIGNDEFS